MMVRVRRRRRRLRRVRMSKGLGVGDVVHIVCIFCTHGPVRIAG